MSGGRVGGGGPKSIGDGVAALSISEYRLAKSRRAVCSAFYGSVGVAVSGVDSSGGRVGGNGPKSNGGRVTLFTSDKRLAKS